MKVVLSQPVEVERIDAYALIGKYEIYSLSGGMWHPKSEVGHSMLCAGHIEWGDWMATGADGKHWIIADKAFKEQYAELPVIDDFVAEQLNDYKARELSLATFYSEVMASITNVNPGYVYKHADDIARAWLDGYQVEDE